MLFDFLNLAIDKLKLSVEIARRKIPDQGLFNLETLPHPGPFPQHSSLTELYPSPLSHNRTGRIGSPRPRRILVFSPPAQSILVGSSSPPLPNSLSPSVQTLHYNLRESMLIKFDTIAYLSYS